MADDLTSYGTRKLPFPLTNEYPNIGATTGDIVAPFNWDEPDSNAEIFVTVELSLNDLVALATCLDVGRDIAYPTTSATLWDLWERIWSNKLALCDTIVEQCLTLDDFMEAVANSLLRIGFGTGSGGGSNSSSNTIGAVVISDSDCSINGHYGLCYAMVEEVHNTATQIIDTFAAAATDVEFAGEMADNVPLIGKVVSAGIDTVQWLLDSVVSLYNIAWSQSSHEEIACELYCQTYDACEITVDDLLSVYSSFMVGTVPPITADFIDIAAYLVTVVGQVDTILVSTVHWLIVQTWRHSSAFFGSTERTLQIAASQANPLAPPLDCECVIYTAEWDFTVSDGGFIQQEGGTRGIYSGGTGWVSSISGGNTGLIIYKALPSGTIVRGVTMEYTLAGANNWTIAALLRNNQNSGTGQVAVINTTVPPTETCSDGSIAGSERAYLAVAVDKTNVTAGGSVLTKIKIQYSGATPTNVTATGIAMGCP